MSPHSFSERQPSIREQLAPTARAEGHSLARHGWRATTFALGALLLNAAALFLAARPSEVDPSRIPSVVLLGIAGVQLLLFGFWLERERPASWQSATSRQVQRALGQRTLFAVALSILSALPSVIYLLRDVPHATHAALSILASAACVFVLAFYQSALWLRRVSPTAAPGLRAYAKQSLKLVLLAALFRLGLLADAERTFDILRLFGLSVVFVIAQWHTSSTRLPSRLDPAAAAPSVLTAADAYLALFVIGFADLLLWALLRGRSGLAPWLAHLLRAGLGGGTLVAVSLLWLRRRGVRLREHLSLGWGHGFLVTVREGLLWSVPSCAFLYADVSITSAYGLVMTTTSSGGGDHFMRAVFSGPSIAGLAVICVAAPITEEILYRGVFYNALRTGWSLVPSLLVSATFFALGHPLVATLPVLCTSVCAGLALERSRSVYAPVIVHVAVNSMIVVIGSYV